MEALSINRELELALDTLCPITYIVAEEEDRVIKDIYDKIERDAKEAKSKKTDDSEEQEYQIYIYRATSGLCKYEDYKVEPQDKTYKPLQNSINFSQTLQVIYENATVNTYSIFILLDIDNYLLGHNEASQTAIRKIKDIILQRYYDLACLKSIVIISPDLCVPLKLQRYLEVIYYDLPNEPQIKTKVESLLEDYNSTISEKNKKIKTSVNKSVVRSLKGLTGFEIEQISLASIKQFKKMEYKAIENYKRTILRKTKFLELFDTDISFDRVGGMDNLKHWLVEREGAWTDKGINLGVPLLKGVLLIGITGCGKSLVAKAIATQWGLPLISFNPSRVFSARVGESENNILKALKIVESISPCVMFIDEIEKQFAGSQSSTFSDAGTTSRVIGSFLTWYNDTTAPVFVVSTCNSIQYLPPELVSRFDDKFFVNIPTFNERRNIFKIQLDSWVKDWKSLNLDLDKLAQESVQLTGREIEQVVKSSMHKMYHEIVTTGKDTKLRERHILQVLNAKVPIVKTMEDEIKYLIQWVGWDEDKKEGMRANWANKRDTEDDIDKMLKDAMSSDSVLKKK